MKKQLLKNVGLLIVLVGLSNSQLSAQTTLGPGDAVFVGFSNVAATKSLSLLLLKDIATGTSINFTNRSIAGTGGTAWTGNFAVDDIFNLTTTSAFAAGTIITINNPTSPANSAPVATTVQTTVNGVEQISAGTLTHTDAGSGSVASEFDFDFTNGDTFFAYQGPILTASWIAGISSHPTSGGGNVTTAIPTTLTAANAFLKLFAGGTGATNGIASAVYSKLLTGTATEILNSVNTPIQGTDIVAANWTSSGNTSPSPYKFWAFNNVVDYPTAIGKGDIGSATLAIQNFELESSVSIFPNPVQNVLNIVAPSDVASATVYTILGSQVLSTAKTNAVNVSGLTSGSYVVSIVLVDGTRTTKKIIKE